MSTRDTEKHPEPALPPHNPRLVLMEQPAEVRQFTSYGLVSDEQGHARLSIDLVIDCAFDLDTASAHSYLCLPLTKEVARALVNESARIHDGKNTTKISLQRTFAAARFLFDFAGQQLEFIGEVKGSPVISVVHEQVMLRFRVAALVPRASAEGLMSVVKAPAVVLTVDNLQGTLPFSASASSAA
jgi:hypothetical protein